MTYEEYLEVCDSLTTFEKFEIEVRDFLEKTTGSVASVTVHISDDVISIDVRSVDGSIMLLHGSSYDDLRYEVIDSIRMFSLKKKGLK
jgi:hypothetical protein